MPRLLFYQSFGCMRFELSSCAVFIRTVIANNISIKDYKLSDCRLAAF